MGLLAQLGLLFKKNVILRLRQPGILVLEVLWPILIVAVVALIRQGVPLRERDTCHYQERAMPSAGITPFLQTFVCNLDNQCHSTYTLSKARETTSTVSRLVQNLAPMLASNDVIEGLQAMDKGVEMLDALVKMANETDALEGFDDMLKVRNFFQSPDYVKQILVQQYKVMDEKQVDAMMDSTVNITLIFDLLGYPDFKGVVCDPLKLGQFLLFGPTVDVRDVSASLCNISNDQIPDITKFLQNQFDIAQLIRIMGKFERVKQRLGQPYSTSMAFNDIADMVDLALQSPTLIKQVMSLASLKRLPDLLRSIPEIMRRYEETKIIDMGPFVRLVHIIDPVVEEFKPNDTLWYLVKYGVMMAAEISDIAQGKINGSMTDAISGVIQTAQKMSGAIEQVIGSIGQDLQMVLGALTQVDWTGIYNQFVNNNLDTQSAMKSLQDLQTSLQQLPEVWEVTAPVVMVTSRFLEMGTIILQETNDLEQVVLGMVNQSGPAQTALSTLFNSGPNVTLAVLSAFTDSKALAKLFESPFSYATFCNGILDDVQDVSKIEISTDLRSAMCSDDIATTIQNLVVSLRIPEIERIINDTTAKLQDLMNGKVPTEEASFTVLFTRTKNFVDTSTAFMNINEATWQNVVSKFHLPNIDLTQRQWEPVLDQLNENYVASAILAMTRGVGVAMDNGNLSPMIGQYIHQSRLIVKYAYDMMNWYTDLYSSSSPLSRMMKMMTTYAPDLVQGMTLMAKDVQQIQQIVSMSDPMAAVCMWFRQMPLPDRVPHEDMNHMVCEELPKVISDFTRNQALTEELIVKMSNMTTVSYNVGDDWSEVVTYTQRMVGMMQDPDNMAAILEGMTNVINQMNFTQVEAAMTLMGNLMANFSTLDMVSISEISLGVMQQLDKMLQYDMNWHNVKLIVNAMNVYMELTLDYTKAGTSSMDAILAGQPVMMREFITKMAKVTPNLMEAVTNIMLNPEKFVKRLLDSPTALVPPDCRSHFVSDYLMVDASSPVREFERFACAMNWTAIYAGDTDPYMVAWIDQVNLLSTRDWSTLPNTPVNWTSVMINMQKMFEICDNQMTNAEFNFAPFNVSAIDMKWTEFIRAAESLQHLDMNKLGEMMTTIQMSLEKLAVNELGGNMTGGMDKLLLNSMYGQLYINHHLMKFASKVLEYMSTHKTVNLLDYMGSEQLRDAMKMTEISPELSGIGLNSIISYLMDPSKISTLISMNETLGMALCTNVTLFTTVFDLRDITTNPATIHRTVCSSAFLNYTAMYEELRQNWDGFADFADAIARLSTDSVPVDELRSFNVSVVITDQATLNYWINQTIYNQPTVVLTANEDWMNMTIYANQWESFMKKLDNVFANYQDSGFMMMWQKSVTKVLSSAYVSVPGFDNILQWMDVILDMVETQLKQSLESIPEAFKSYPNLSKMLSLVQKMPEAFLVVAYTDMAFPQKVMKWTEAMKSWDSFCSSDSTQLFETPAGVTFSMENYLSVMCSINITALGLEMAQYEGTDRLNQLIMSPESMGPANVTAVAVKMASLIETLTSISTRPINTGGDLRIFNETVWMNVINKLSAIANSTAMMSLENLQTTLTQTVLSSFQAIPGFSTALNYLDVILDIVKDQIQRSLVSLPEAFKEYPNMNTLLELLNDLPSLIEVTVYTNLKDPRKLSRWGTAMTSFEGFCATDPDTLMTVPPNLNFDLPSVLNKLCSINFTALMQEAERYQGSDRIIELINSGNETEPVNATAVMKKLTDIINMFTKNTSSLVMPQSQPSVFNASVWTGMFNRITGYMNQSSLDAITGSIFGTAQDVFNNIPGLQLGGLETVMAVMETLLDRIIRLENATSFAPRDIFPDAPQLQALMDIVEEPGVLPVLLESLNSQKMTPLFMMNMTTAFITLCMPGADITNYLTILPGITIDVSKLQSDFCSINVTHLESEVLAAFDVARIERVAAGEDHVNWLGIGDKFQRVITLMTKWSEMPPRIVLPTNWDNETFWLNMLTQYNMARSTPQAINEELKNVLIRMGPLLMQDPFRQYGVVMETVLKLLNENMVAMQNTTMTVTSMFEVIPVLRDVITALGLNADVLETLLTAPVKNPELFTRALVNPASPSYVCTNFDMWNQILVLPPSFDTSALTNAVCNQNTSAIVANLVRNLDLESAIRNVANMSAMPNWENIFAQSQELAERIDQLIKNPPTFKVNESLALLEQAYNQSNLWNMVIAYNVMAQAFGNSSEFGSVDDIMRGSQVVITFLNDMFQKMSVKGVTLDLQSLFQGSPTFLRLVDTMLHLRPDPITGLASIQLKPSQNMAFAQLATNPAQLVTVFCDETKFLQYFTVAPGFNLSSVLPVLCTMNFTQLADELDSNFMVTAMINKLNQRGQPFDLQAFVTANMQLNEKIMALVNVRNVTFGDVNLEQAFQINTTALMEVFRQQSQVLERDYQTYISTAFNSLFSSMENVTEWKSVAIYMKIFDIYLKYLNQNLKAITGKPLSLSLLVNNTELGSVLLPLLSDPRWLDEVLQLQVRSDKLQEVIQDSTNGKVCSSALWDAFVSPTNQTGALEYLQQRICSLNESVLMWQSIVFSAQGYQFYQQVSVLTQELYNGMSTVSLNSTELSADIMETVQLVTAFINSLINSTLSADNFFNVTGFQSVMNNLQMTLTNRLMTLSSELSTAVTNLVWPNIPDQNVANNMARVINTINIFMTVINDRLEDIKDGNLTLDTLSNQNPQLLSLMEAYINVTKYGLQAWMDGQIHLEKVIELMSDQSALTTRCQDGSVATFISQRSEPALVVKNLQTVICTYSTDLPNEFRSLVDYQTIEQQVTALWNSTGTVTPNFAGYTREVQRFNELLTIITQKNIQASKNLLNTLDFSSLMQSFNNIAQNPSVIFQLLKPLGVVLSNQLPNNELKMVSSILDTTVILPLTQFMQILQDNGLSLEAMMRDPNNVLKAVDITSNFNTQMAVIVKSYVEPVFKSLGKDASFVRTMLCNETNGQAYIGALYVPAVRAVFCNDDPTTWIQKLRDLDFGNVQLYSMAMKMVTAHVVYSTSCLVDCPEGNSCARSCSYIPPVEQWFGDVTWVQLMSDMEKLTNMFTQPGSSTGQAIVPTNNGNMASTVSKTLQNILQSAFGTMAIVDTYETSMEWAKIKQAIHFMGKVNDYFNHMLERFTNSTSVIYLQDVFPDSNKVARLLAGVIGEDNAAEFLTAALNPVKFFEKMAQPQYWEEMLCDFSQFNMTFTFPPGIDGVRIQQAMCNLARNQSSSLDQLVNLFNAGDVLAELEKLTKPPTAMGFSLWDRVKNSTLRLINNFEKLQNVNVNGTSAMAWFNPILNTLQSLQDPSRMRNEAYCNQMVSYVQNTEMFRQARPFFLEAVGYMQLAAQQISFSGVIDDVICALTQELDLNKALDILKTSGFWDSLSQTNYLATYKGEDPVQCSKVIKSFTDLVAAINATAMNGNFADWNRIGPCLESGSKQFGTFVTGMDSFLKLAASVIPVLRDPDVMTLFQMTDVSSILEFIVKVFSQQRQVLLQFSDLLKNDTSIEMYLMEVLQMSPQLINSLLKSSINLDAVNFLNQPVEEIQKTLCNVTRLEQVLTLPNFTNVDLASLSRLLCTNTSLDTAAVLKSTAQATELLQQIISAAQTGIDQTFFNNISTNIFNLINDLQSITDIAALFSSGFNLDILKGNIDKIDQFLISNGPDKIVQSLTAVMEDIRRMLPPGSEADTVIKEINIFIRGFAGLDIVQSYFLESLTVVDFLKNPTAVYDYLVKVVGMTPKNAETVLQGTFSVRVFLNSSYILDKDFACKDMFGQLIILNTTAYTVDQITHNLCQLNESAAIQIANLLVPQLTIGDLVKRYVSLSADELFKSANITAAEASELATKLSNAQKDLLKAADILTSKSVAIGHKGNELLEELFNLPQAQTGPNTMESVQPLLCGMKPGDLVGDDFKIEAVFGGSSKATLDTNEVKELSEVDKESGGDFCQNMYRDIKNEKLGAIIWAYLKPIMRGKIVFAPNTEYTRRIIDQANSVFKTMMEVQRVAKVWSKGAPHLMSMSVKAKEMGNVKNALENEFVSSLLRGTTGLDTKELLSGLDALEKGNFNSSSINGMKVAADLVVNYTSCMEMKRFVVADSEEELEKIAFKLAKNNTFLAGIVFTNLPEESGRRKRQTGSQEIPQHIQYKIRMESDNVKPTSRLKSRYWQPAPDDNFASDMQYLRGFMQLQDMIERAIIAVQTGDNTTLPGVYLKQFPFPCHTNDIYIGILGSYLLPVVMTFAWLAALTIATRNLVYDREYGQEEALKIMGMKPFLNWFAWVITTLVLMMLVSVILMIVLKFSKLFNMSDPSIVFLYLVCFCVSTTMMCYFVSAFFTRVTLAILTVLIVYFLSYLPYVILVSMEVSMTFWQKTLACLFSTSAFGFAAQYLARLEIQNVGLQWSNINVSPIPEDPMTFSWACYMMLIDSAIYLVLGWYIRNVLPGKFGISQPWYFPVTPNYWCPKSQGRMRGIKAKGRSQNVTVFESGSSTGIPGMAFRDLTKRFGKKTVVDNISADFCEGQVTALLGHNGAAKTTTMNMLIGILEPTSGEVYINKDGSSGNLGYCPQHNILLDYMTVMEHMELYAGVKCNWSRTQKNSEIKSLLNDVDLYHVRDVRVNQLSGGMKRRLCVALAFVGGSTAVVLDEPTSGVDPSARKHIWNLIIKQRIGRTILLSTHHLDEADTVGDTVAIMHNGHILCCGSPFFLKEKLGGGYHLIVDKSVKQADDGYSGNESDCKGREVLSFIQTMQPEAQLVEEVGTDLIFNLPRNGSGSTTFGAFFTELDNNLNRLNISSYGVSDTTLEDVFLKVTALADDGISLNEDVLEKERLKLTRNRSGTETESDTTSEGSSQDTAVNMIDSSRQRYSGLSLKLQQMYALLLKRVHHYRRNWRMFLSIVLLPLILFFVSMGFAQIRPSAEAEPKLLMTPDLYGPENYMFVKDMNSYLTISDLIADSFKKKPGVGTTCMEGFDPELPITCDMTSRNYSKGEPATKSGSCKCVEHKQICDPGMVPIPPQMETPAGNYLQNLRGIDIPNYLLTSFEDFVEKRYGGWVVENGRNGSEPDLTVTIWYNNRGYHTMPSFVNAYSNAFLRAKMEQRKSKDPSKFGISLYSHPFTFETMKLSFNDLGTQATDAGIALVFLLAFTFIPSAFMVYLVNENLNKEKQLQFIVGVGSGLYWMTSFLWDLVVYSFTVALAVAVLAIFQIGPYWDRMNLAALVSLLMLYGWSVLPMMYMTLKLFQSASAAYLTLFCVNMLIGILSIISVFCLILFQSLGMPGVVEAYNVCRYLFLIFPQFCLGQGLIDITKNHFQYILFIRFGEDTYQNPFTFELLGWNLVAMGIEGLVFFLIAVFIESRHGTATQIPRRLLEIHDEDDDVRNERNRIQIGHIKDDIMYINGLTKMYRHGIRKFLAVDNISFGVRKGECFGLLGVNGAGKTTTFRMLTGDTSPSSGEAFLNGHRISRGDPGIGQEIGYCPQEGGLDNYLSGEELLYCHARLKGMSDTQTKQTVTDLVGKFKLSEYIQKPINTYSGGTKRKLSLAVAMLGEPPILFLDEPTTGMDPSTRRLVWKCITKAGQNGQSIVLTSHSMDECDALCSRLAIMVNGQFRCLGSSQHLKSKFGDGYTVIMHIQGLSNNRFNIEQAFLTRFPGAKVKDQHQSVLEVSIPRGVTSVAELFNLLQAAEEKKHIIRYSLSQTTLDTVFVNFAREQSDSVSDKDDGSTSGSISDQPGMLSGPFTNQTYAYMNPEYMADPEDVRLSSPSQYAANLARASDSLTSSFKGKQSAKGQSQDAGQTNKAFKSDEDNVVTRL